MTTARSLGELFFAQAARLGEKPFLHAKDAKDAKGAGGWKARSFARCAAEVAAVADALVARGLAPGARVAILSENRPEWFLADLACLSAGLVDVPIYPTNPEGEVEALLRRSGSEALFVSTPSQWQRIASVCARLPKLRHVFLFDDAHDGAAPSVRAERPELAGWSTLVASVAPPGRTSGRTNGRGHVAAVAAVEPGVAVRARLAALAPTDVATILYTSGTTGDPKGVMLTHGNLLSNCAAMLQHMGVTEADRTLSFLPLSHSFERTAGHFALLMAGGEIAYATSPEKVATEVREIKPTLVLGVPRFYEKVRARILGTLERAPKYRRALFEFALRVSDEWSAAKEAGGPLHLRLRVRRELADRLVFSLLRRRMGGRVRFFVSGGAPLDPEIVRFFTRVGLPLLEGYGLTEASPVVTCNQPDAARAGSVGRVLPGVEVRVADDGELLVKGPNVMLGYFEQPEATAAVLDADGCFHTGDVGHVDADGFVFVTDRKKDLIIGSGGKNVSPARVEGLLKRHRLIGDVCLVGDRHPYLVALVVPDEGALKNCLQEQGLEWTNRAEMVDHERVRALFREAVARANEELAPPERVRRFALLLDPFSQENRELTPTLKVRRKVVETRYRSLIGALYADAPAPASEGVPICVP
ncbi:MAG TPA: long-chain fatty acid--CoA ligase [Planctomycetota bacterium]|jgi:long-chain acyl-CoA synthetase|nr:long-chain fatty acid--CoA ligase [Planctomycetota bacterium]